MTLRAVGRLAGVGGCLLAVILAAGCAGRQGTSAAGSTTTTSPPTSTTAPATTTTTPPPTVTTSPASGSRPTPPTSRAGQPRECRAADLTLSFGALDSGMGHRYRALDFTNSSKQSCFLVGFPGISYVDAHGRQVGAAAVRDGRIGAPVTHQAASAIVDMLNVDMFDPTQCDPQPVSGLRVYPPDSTVAMYIPRAGTGCALPTPPSPQLHVQTILPGPGNP